MKLLVVMTHNPFPPLDGSSVVAFNNMKHLSKRHQIDFICLQSQQDSNCVAEFVEHQEWVSRKVISGLAKWVNYFLYMLKGVPSSVSAFASNELKVAVKRTIESKQYDAILLFEMKAIQYIPLSFYKKLIVNIEDPQSIKLSRMAKLPVYSMSQRIKWFALAKLTGCYEKKHFHKIAKVLLLSTSDIRDMYQQEKYSNLAHVVYGVARRDSNQILGYTDRDRVIILSGSMYHQPNVDGALFFLENIFPLILKAFPSAILWIVGANPDQRIIEASTKYGMQVDITGKVDDMTAYIKRATVSICPVRLKVGVQTKILEALSWGTPVVTTSAGNSGIGGVSGSQLWVEDEPKQFAQRVVELLQGDRWINLSEEGRKFVVEYFSWEDSAVQLDQHIESLVVSN